MTSTNELADRTGGQDRARWTALVVLCVGMLMIALDATAVNVALPVIQADLGLSQSSLAWVVNAYLVAFGGLLLLAGRLGDLVSRRRDVRHVRLGVLYLQTVLGYDAMRTGMAFLPNSLVMGLLSVRYAEPLVTRFGARTTLVSGLVLIGAGLALFSRVPVGGAYLIDVLPATLLLGTGVGVSFPALMICRCPARPRVTPGWRPAW